MEIGFLFSANSLIVLLIVFHHSCANLFKECVQEYFESKSITKRLKPSKILNFLLSDVLLDDECSDSISLTLNTMSQLLKADMESNEKSSESIDCALKEFKSAESKDFLLTALLREMTIDEPEVFMTTGKKSKISSIRKRSIIEEFVENIKQECQFKLEKNQIFDDLADNGLKYLNIDNALESCVKGNLVQRNLIDEAILPNFINNQTNNDDNNNCEKDIQSMHLSFKTLITKLGFTQCFSEVLCNDTQCRLLDEIFLIHFTRNQNHKDKVSHSYQSFTNNSIELMKRCRLNVPADHRQKAFDIE